VETRSSVSHSEPFRYAFSPLVDEVSEEEEEQLMNEAFGKSFNWPIRCETQEVACI